jgi:hypothetical protein
MAQEGQPGREMFGIRRICHIAAAFAFHSP